jgi:phosphonate transport system substrate-binding protein
MKKYIVGILILILTLACSPTEINQKGLSQTQQQVRIGLQPTDGENNLEDLRVDLSKRMGMDVSFVISKNYDELVEMFKSKKLDFAFFTALNFLKAEREAGAKALLKKVYGKDEFYYSALVVLADSGIQKISNIKGKKIGFVDPKSTSGYFYPRVMLRSEGFDAGVKASAENVLEHEFFGTHDKALKGLLDGKVDVVGVWASDPKTGEGAWSEDKIKALNSKNKKFKVLLYSEPIPNDAFAVRGDFFKQNPMFVYQIMESLIGASEDRSGVLKKALNVDRLVTATSRHYDSVRGLENLIKQVE